MGLRSARWIFSIIAISRTSKSENSRTTMGNSCNWASWEARHRRSPATISYSPVFSGCARTTSGWIIPFERIDPARSFNSSTSKCRRGWSGFGCTFSIGTSISLRRSELLGPVSPTVCSISAISADRPRPRPLWRLGVLAILYPNSLSSACQNFLCKGAIGLCAFGSAIITQHGHRKGRRLAYSHVSRNDRFKNQFAQVFPRIFLDLQG